MDQLLKIVSICKNQPQDEEVQSNLQAAVDAIIMFLTEGQPSCGVMSVLV